MTDAAPNPARRDLLKAAGGLVVAIAWPNLLAAAEAQVTAPRLPGSLDSTRSLSAWLRINPDATVTVFTGKVELGQGIASAIAQLAAEELDVAYARIRVVTADTARTPDEGFTAGSQSVEQAGAAIRQAAAEARHLLLAAAASKLGVSDTACTVVDGEVSGPSGLRTSYWELVTDGMLQREATGAATPKGPGEFKLIGQSLQRRDLPAKFTGGAAYVQDLRLPGLVHARIGRPPSPRAELLDLDLAALRSMPGVIEIVRDGRFIAVVCEREEQAVNARNALERLATWSQPDPAPRPFLPDEQADSGQAAAAVVYERHSPLGAATVQRVAARYTRPFQLHASIGPSCAVALAADGGLTIWTHSQGVFALRSDLSRALGIPAARLNCVHMEGAGCYGHNGADDAAFDAALIARAVPGRPVRLQWMREDEFLSEPAGPAMSVRVEAGLSADGEIVDWRHELWSYPHARRPGVKDGINLLAAQHLAKPLPQAVATDIPQPSGGSDRNAIPLYEFQNQYVAKHFLTDGPLRSSALRSLGAYANVFAIESLMDEAALVAGADPISIRLRHLRDDRARAVIEKVARMSGWRPGMQWDRGAGTPVHGRGIGFARYKNHACYCAVVAQIEVDRVRGLIRVTRAWAAVDAGLVVNPDGVVNQIEGGLIQATSWTLKEGISAARPKAWSDYPILRFSEVPVVEVALMSRPADAPLGVGEGAQGPTAAAIANAFAAATGRRLRDMPFSPQRVLAALGRSPAPSGQSPL